MDPLIAMEAPTVQKVRYQETSKMDAPNDAVANVSLKKLAVRFAGRLAPSALRFFAHRNPTNRARWPLLSALRDDPKCRDWLASLENPTRTRRGFQIFTLLGDLTSDWIKVHGQHETGTERFILDHLTPGTTFIDVGANIGYFSLLAASVSKASVVAFEPQPAIAELLRKSVVFNHLEELVKVESLALSNAPSTMKMTACPGNSGHSQITRTGTVDTQSFDVQVVALDTWMKHNPTGPVSVCKIDTEGSEIQVLEGMSDLLDRDGPAIVIEVIEEFLAGFGGSESRMLGLLKSRGYIEVSKAYTFRGDPNRYFAKVGRK